MQLGNFQFANNTTTIVLSFEVQIVFGFGPYDIGFPLYVSSQIIASFTLQITLKNRKIISGGGSRSDDERRDAV